MGGMNALAVGWDIAITWGVEGAVAAVVSLPFLFVGVASVCIFLVTSLPLPFALVRVASTCIAALACTSVDSSGVTDPVHVRFLRSGEVGALADRRRFEAFMVLFLPPFLEASGLTTSCLDMSNVMPMRLISLPDSTVS